MNEQLTVLHPEYQEKLIFIAEHYGLKHQSKKLIEEMAEYIAAKSRQLNATDRDNLSHLKQEANAELADVIVICEQMKYLMNRYAVSDYQEVQRIAQEKIDRQIRRINQEKEIMKS